jgi:hypothetical protein
MTRYRVSFEKTTGSGKPSKTATEVSANSVAEAKSKVMSTHGSASNVKIKILSTVAVK